MSKTIEVCRIEDVPDGDARGFTPPRPEGDRLALIVVRRGDTALVYENRCPHRGTPLDWRPDVFFDSRHEHLMCSTHGALFRVDDGVCVAGPCAGDALTELEVEVREGRVWLVLPVP